MSKHIELPHHFYVNVNNYFLGPTMSSGVTKGIWWGCYSRMGQVIMCHVLLESGAHWSGIPIQQISTSDDFSKTGNDLMPWAAMGDDMDLIHNKYLEGLKVNTIQPFIGEGRHTGVIIDYKDGYSRYPQEHKPLNLISLSSGQFALLPNNFVIIEDLHFTDNAAKENLKHYKRNDKIFWES